MLAGLSLLVLSAACDDGGAGVSPGDLVTGPMVVDCSFSWEAQTTTVRIDGPDAEPLAFGELRVSARFFDDEFEGRSFSVTAYTEDGVVGHTALYQLRGQQHPRNEFVGQHGFTGLNWVSEPASKQNLQYACFARSPDDPVQGWDD